MLESDFMAPFVAVTCRHLLSPAVSPYSPSIGSVFRQPLLSLSVIGTNRKVEAGSMAGVHGAGPR